MCKSASSIGKSVIANGLNCGTAQFPTCSPTSTVIPPVVRRKFPLYTNPTLLALDEAGHLAYDAHATEMFFEVINHRYERNSTLLTS